MADRSKAYEITITALGVVVTAMLGYGQYRLQTNQAKASEQQQKAESTRAIDSIEVQVMTLVAPHLSFLAKPGPEFASAERIVVAASEYLTDQHGRTGLAKMAARISQGNKDASPQGIARLQEATTPPLSSTGWFAVLATLPPDSETEAKRQADIWLTRARAKTADATVALYKTKISNSYAVVLGGRVDQTKAAELAQQARSLGLVPDAFAQRDRDWQRVGEAPFPK